ncbi:MAG: TonB-dependent receptor plug, partial [Deltaproteobacteria bacterium]|nr:TonB-dependent receptor plug [Deltaproteobacteria bacterium]
LSKSTTQRLVQRQVDGTDGKAADGVPDVDPDTGIAKHELVSSSDIPRDFQTYFFTGKINGAVNQNNQFQISTFGNPRSATDLLGVTRNPAQTRWKYKDGAYDVAGKWTSKLNDGKTQIDGVLGYHRGFNNESAYDSAQETPFVYYNYDRSLADFSDIEGTQIAGCDDNDPDDPYPEIMNCPVFGYAESGISLLQEELKARTSVNVSATQRVKAAGYHVFKAGIDAEFAQYNAETRYTGGSRYRRSADTAAGAPGRWQLREYFERTRNLTDAEAMDPSSVVLEPGQALCANDQAICQRADAVVADTNNRNLGAFLQDSWQIRPNLTLNVGLRWEQQIGYVADQLAGDISPEGEIIPDEAYKLDNMVAPRIGFIYDPTREGKSKLFGHYGQFYENVPMDLNVRAYGGEILNIQNLNQNRRLPTSGAYDANCDVDHTPGMSASQLATTLDQCQDRGAAALLGGGFEYVSPGLKGQRTDEVILGAEYEMAADFKIGANYIHRSLPVVIEDISVDGGNNYLITNPGFNFDEEADRLSAEALRLMASSSPKDQALGAVYQNRADSLYNVKRLVKPVRSYDALQLTATQRPTKESLLMASYTYSQSKGNYPGLFSTETGQNDPNLTSLYDLPDLMANRYGPMGLDRPHNLKVDGFYVFDFKKVGYVVAGGSFRAQSGIAHNVLAAHAVYGSGEAYLLPRGAAERSPLTTQLDVRLAYGKNLSKTTKLEGFVNVFNLFNSQEQLNTDENYTFEFANPVIGGDAEDLKHIKTLGGASGEETNVTPVKNKNFGNTGSGNGGPAQQSSRSIQLGFRVTF